MAELDCGVLKHIDSNDRASTCLAGLIVSICVSILIAGYVTIPIMNIVAIFWYTESFDTLMYVYLSTVCLECLLQVLVIFPSYSYSSNYTSLQYVIPYYYPTTFALLVCNSTLSMMKCNVSFPSKIGLFVVGRIFSTFIAWFSYHHAGGEKKKQEARRASRERLIVIPQAANVQHVYFAPPLAVDPHVIQVNPREVNVVVE